MLLLSPRDFEQSFVDVDPDGTTRWACAPGELQGDVSATTTKVKALRSGGNAEVVEES